MDKAAWINFLNGWVTGILTNRADQSWTPSLYAHSDMAWLGIIADLPVQANDALPTGDLVLMGTGVHPPPVGRWDPPEGPFFDEMARYSGIYTAAQLAAKAAQLAAKAAQEPAES